MASPHHLRVSTNLSDLNQVLSWFEQLNQPSIPRKTWIQCQTVLAEGFTNAVRHAHKGLSSTTPIDIEVNQTPHRLQILIWDSGPAFDLVQKLESQQQVADLNAASGRGLYLIHQLADEFSYTRTTDQRNCLAIVKDYQAE